MYTTQNNFSKNVFDENYTVTKSARITEQQNRFLQKNNIDFPVFVRKKIDEEIKKQKQKHIRETLLFLSISTIFLLFAVTTNNLLQTVFASICGTIFAAYGILLYIMGG